MISGCILTLEPGAPGISVIDRLPLNPDYRVIIGYLSSISTKQVLNSTEKRREVNRYGNQTLKEILKKPTLENFLDCSLDFAKKTGFLTPQLKQLSDLAVNAGAIGSSKTLLARPYMP
jgi:pantoate kinase